MNFPNKDNIKNLVVQKIEQQLSIMKAAAFDAKEAATNEESKAENKYDTRGLEASYLAGAQAQRAAELANHLETIKQLNPKSYSAEDHINLGALVTVEADGQAEYYFTLPFEGGIELIVDNLRIMTISPDSPIGKGVFNQQVGHVFEITRKSTLTEMEITKLI